MFKGTVTSGSQPHKLQKHMDRAGLRHADTVRANLRTVNVLPTQDGRRHVEMRFCPMDQFEVIEVVAVGDGQALPETVKVKGLSFPGPGVYDIENALVSSNGTLQLNGDGATRIIRREHTPRPLHEQYMGV